VAVISAIQGAADPKLAAESLVTIVERTRSGR
jgi:thiamine monophosphate synthase